MYQNGEEDTWNDGRDSDHREHFQQDVFQHVHGELKACERNEREDRCEKNAAEESTIATLPLSPFPLSLSFRSKKSQSGSGTSLGSDVII